MRATLIVIGIALLAAGIWIAIGHGSYRRTDTLVQIGPAKLEATHDKAVPPWVGFAGIVLGAVLAVGGFVRKH